MYVMQARLSHIDSAIILVFAASISYLSKQYGVYTAFLDHRYFGIEQNQITFDCKSLE